MTAHTPVMPHPFHSHCHEDRHDSLSDIARARRPGRDYRLGRIVVIGDTRGSTSCAGSGRRSHCQKTLTEIRSLAHNHTRSAITVPARIMRSKDATPAARVSAANALLDRGWGKGKAAQPLQNGDDGALELIHRIERVIVYPEHVHPENSDSKNL
jgi:hypothetical protein